MKLAFIWDWPPTMSQTLSWEDGLAAAIRELQRRGHAVRLFMPDTSEYVIKHPYFDIEVCEDIPYAVRAFEPEAILLWGDMTRPNIRPLRMLNVPLLICFAGGEVNHQNAGLFDHIFVESQVYLDHFQAQGLPVSIAFGTNTELFQPVEQAKAFDTIFPATFALWKRHNLYARAVEGLRALAVGYMYDDHEQECWQDCLAHGVTILPHTSAQVLRYLYAASEVCVIPSLSSGGSQRTVLEAMAMNLPLVVCDSDKFDYLTDECLRVAPTPEALREAIETQRGRVVQTRDHVLAHWSHLTYADALEKELEALCAHP